MNISELNNFNITDAVNFHTELNPQLFLDEEMRPDVHKKLMDIAKDFMEFLGVDDIALVDITISGSNAAYSYTPHSDIDLHLVIDFNKLNNDDVYRELFDAKKYEYNDKFDITIKSYEVELYVQDSKQKHISLGEYSILHNKWNKLPSTISAEIDDDNTKLKYKKLKGLALRALASDNMEYLEKVLHTIKKYRKAGLDEKGEFSPENLAFKMLRSEGYIKRLWDKRNNEQSSELSLEHAKHINETIYNEIASEFSKYLSEQKSVNKNQVISKNKLTEARRDSLILDLLEEFK